MLLSRGVYSCFFLTFFSPVAVALAIPKRDVISLKTGYFSTSIAGYTTATQVSTANLVYEWDHFLDMKTAFVNGFHLSYSTQFARMLYQGMSFSFRYFPFQNALSYEEDIEGSTVAYGSTFRFYGLAGLGLGKYLLGVIGEELKGAEEGTDSYGFFGGLGLRTGLSTRYHLDAEVKVGYSKNYGALVLRAVELSFLLGLSRVF